jgi:transcriptional regulator GlxA family with amidase domain
MSIGFLIFPAAEELDFVGPWEMIATWSRHLGGPQPCVLVAQSQAPVVCANGMSVNPDIDLESCPPLDYLLVPGGPGTRKEVDNAVLIDFIARRAKQCKAMLSVCTGAFLLHRAGLLSGRRATTHWGSLDRLRALGEVTVVEERWVRDGDVWSSAGVSAGIDMTLAFIASTAGDEIAGKVQFGAEYYPSGAEYGDMRSHAKAPAYIRGRNATSVA